MPSMPRAEWIERGKTPKFLRREQTSGCGRNGPIAWSAYEHESARLGDTIKSCEQLTVDERSDQELNGAHQAPPQIKIAPSRNQTASVVLFGRNRAGGFAAVQRGLNIARVHTAARAVGVARAALGGPPGCREPERRSLAGQEYSPSLLSRTMNSVRRVVASISAWWLSALSPRSRGSGGMWR